MTEALLISVLALLVSAGSLSYTLSARSRLRAFAIRSYVAIGESAHHDGDEIVITNIGRTPAIIFDVRALTADGRHLKAASMPRGLDRQTVAFPDLPVSLPQGGVLKVWFATNLAGVDAGVQHGYVVTYASTGVLRRRRFQRELNVKAEDKPPPVVPPAL